jgi:hypothetical protein
MPRELRPRYAQLLCRALRRGGVALVLTGRLEADDAALALARRALGAEHMGSAEKAAASASAEAAATGPAETAPARPGPSLLALAELQELFPGEQWEWRAVTPSTFDLTPAYAAMPRPPAVWLLELHRR